jgi:succinyl-diaminopimelate desuccinylase
LVRVLHGLTAAPLDAGSEGFEPSTLQVTGFDVGNAASNVIPAEARAMLNIRFNDRHTGASLTRCSTRRSARKAPATTSA